MNRRLPVYLVLDTSGSMSGEPITAVNTGVSVMVSSLRQDPHALESVYLSMITFDSQVRVVMSMTALDEAQVPEVVAPQSGPTHLGAALELLVDQYHSEIRRSTADQKGDWAPFLFVMTDGKPSDRQLYSQMCPKVRGLGFASIIGCAAGPAAQTSDLAELCDHVVSLDTMDSQSFSALFAWVSSTVSGGNRSLGAVESVALPPPPPEIQLVN